MLTVVTDSDTFSLSVDTSITVENLKAILETDSGIPAAKQVLTFNGRVLSDDSISLAAYKIADDDLLILAQQDPAGGSSSSGGGAAKGLPAARQPTEDEIAEELRSQIQANPQAMAQLRESHPQIADAVASGNTALFKRFIDQQRMVMASSMPGPSQAMMELANADPFDPEAQAKIEETIRQERVLENMEHAMEYSPESFGRVTMLYVDTTVNGTNVKAFVDSGAQATIMSPECAERCGIMRLIDRRFAGIARGVGTAKILGRVHSAQIRLGERLYLPCSFTIMEGKGVEMLFGLDMLKRFQAIIDLKENALLVGDEKIRFLDEHELPANARLDNAGEDEEDVQQQTQGTSQASLGIGVDEAAKRNAEAAAGSAMRIGNLPIQDQSLAGSSRFLQGIPGSGFSWEHKPNGSGSKSTAAASGSGSGSSLTTSQLQGVSLGSAPGSSASASVAESQAAGAASGGTNKWPAASIKSLVDLGATEKQAGQLLDAASGNLEVAASLLFQG